MRFVLDLWPDLDDETPEALLAFAVEAVQSNPDLRWDIYDDQDNLLAENVRLPMNEAEVIARATGSVAATVTHERRTESGDIVVDRVETYDRRDES